MSNGVKKTILLMELQEGSSTWVLWSDKNGAVSEHTKTAVKGGLGFPVIRHR